MVTQGDYFRFETLVFHNYFSDRCAIITGATGHEMKLPHFSPRKNFEKLSKQDEGVFAEASELALLRLEQCIADLRLSLPTMRDAIQPRRLPPVRKYTNLF